MEDDETVSADSGRRNVFRAQIRSDRLKRPAIRSDRLRAGAAASADTAPDSLSRPRNDFSGVWGQRRRGRRVAALWIKRRRACRFSGPAVQNRQSQQRKHDAWRPHDTSPPTDSAFVEQPNGEVHDDTHKGAKDG